MLWAKAANGLNENALSLFVLMEWHKEKFIKFVSTDTLEMPLKTFFSTNHATYGCVLSSSLSCYKSVERVLMLWRLKSSETRVTLCLCNMSSDRHTCASHQEPDAELTEQSLVMLVVLFVVKLQVVQGMMGWRQTHLTPAVQLKLPQLRMDFGLFQQTVNIHQITVINAYLFRQVFETCTEIVS